MRGGGAGALSVHSLAMRVERFMRAKDLQTDSPLLALWRAKPETNGAPVVCLELAPALERGGGAGGGLGGAAAAPGGQIRYLEPGSEHFLLISCCLSLLF